MALHLKLFIPGSRRVLFLWHTHTRTCIHQHNTPTHRVTHTLAGYSKILTSESKRGVTVDSRQGERETGEGGGGGEGGERERFKERKRIKQSVTTSIAAQQRVIQITHGQGLKRKRPLAAMVAVSPVSSHVKQTPAGQPHYKEGQCKYYWCPE